MSWFSFIWIVLCSVYVIITPRSLPKFYNYWAHLTSEVTLVIFYLTTFALLTSEIPLWDDFDNKSWAESLDKTLVPAARASKAAVALSLIQFITLVVSMGFLAYSIHTYRAASTSKSVHARQIHSSNLSHHNMTPLSSYFPSTPHLLSRSETPSSPRPVFSRQDRPISLPVLQKRPEIGGTYRMRETYDRNIPTQSEYKDREKRKEIRAHDEMTMMESSEDDDERRTDFSPATSPQAETAINFCLSVAVFKMLVGYHLLAVFGPYRAVNDEFHNLLEVTMSEGTILRPVCPAPVSCTTYLLGRTLDIIQALMGQQSPQYSAAAGFSDSLHFFYSGFNPNGEWYQLYQIGFGSVPARPINIGDGPYSHCLFPPVESIPNEEIELSFPRVLKLKKTSYDRWGDEELWSCGKRGGISSRREEDGEFPNRNEEIE
ncbi:hypothetical protein EYC80_007716 [Monilinia laxa]|uniref:Hydantoinase B/oxoprolinase domain-containing protein n=1 Tax=Monilinia laxa TaxID=61186 RepID=A0A5N6JWS6_MONLA|nr:hypothetical protein EYC80_007716 [Monilinia laxa]